MNPQRGLPASAWLAKARSRRPWPARSPKTPTSPTPSRLAPLLAGGNFPTTLALARTVAAAVPGAGCRRRDVRRVFQAIRIEVNEEFNALDTLLRTLPGLPCKPGGDARRS